MGVRGESQPVRKRVVSLPTCLNHVRKIELSLGQGPPRQRSKHGTAQAELSQLGGWRSDPCEDTDTTPHQQSQDRGNTHRLS
jgi:hypothetical protein